MNDYVDCNLAREVLDTMLIAKNISNEFQEREITALDFFLASLEYADSTLLEMICEMHEQTAERLTAQANVVAIMSNKRLYEKYIGISYESFIQAKKVKEDNKNFVIQGFIKQDILTLEAYMLVMNLDYGLSRDLENALGKAKAIYEQLEVNSIDLDTLLYCIISDVNSRVSKYIAEQYKVDVQELKKELGDYLGLEGLILNPKEFEKKKANTSNAIVKQSSIKIPDSIKNCVTNLNSKFSKIGRCDIMGRDDEIYEVWNIISKKTKRNAILIGEPGVGKSAIVEAITYSIIEGTCPKDYRGHTVLELNLNAMVAGTHYRGDFEAKVQDLVDFIQTQDKLIVFVDEIHQIIGAGNAEGSGPDLAGSIKPILARDDVVFIGATTMDEYNRIFESDGALSRRFERVVIEEPKGKKLRDMVKGRVKTLSEFHNVSCTREMLENIIESMRKHEEQQEKHIEQLYRQLEVKDEQIKQLSLLISQQQAIHMAAIEAKPDELNEELWNFVAWLLSKTKVNEKCTLISIVPAFHWQGVTMFDRSDRIDSSGTMQFLRDSISIDLAGRIAQQYIESDIDTGASSDIQHLVKQIEYYYLKCGMSDEFKHYAFVDGSELKITDEDSKKLRDKVQKLINEVYDETQKLMDDNKEGLERVAKLLYDKKIITATQAKNVFYNKGNKVKAKPKEPKKVKAEAK